MPDETERPHLVRLAAEIQKELQDLERLYSEMNAASARLVDQVPDTYDLRAIGSILHDFYCGVEKVFVRIAEEMGGGVPAGQDWHKQLLTDMTLDIPGSRYALINEDLAQRLEEYLRFRHLFRHSYGFTLSYDRLRPLIGWFAPTYLDFQQACSSFVDFLRLIEKG